MQILNFTVYFAFLLLLSILPLGALQAQSLEVFKKRDAERLLLVERPETELRAQSSLQVSSGKFTCDAIVKKFNEQQLLLQVAKGCPHWVQLSKSKKISAKFSNKSPLLTAKVAEFDFGEHQIKVVIPGNQDVYSGSIFNLFAFDSRFCSVTVEKVEAGAFYASTNACEFEFEIRTGMRVELQKQMSEKKQGAARSIDRYYLSMGIFYPSLSYGGVAEKRFTDSLKQDSTITHMAFSFELLGLYFPNKNYRYWWGGSLRMLYDGYNGGGTSFQIYHTMASASLLAFYNHQQKLSGPYLRVDLGVAQQLATQVTDSTTGEVALPGSKIGYGLLLGGGWAFAQRRNYIMPWLGYSYRSTSDSDIGIIELGLSYFF